jgi:hypothetical protein
LIISRIREAKMSKALPVAAVAIRERTRSRLMSIAAGRELASIGRRQEMRI